MGKLFASPLTIAGELHDVHLFNFSIPLEEVRHLVPEPLRPAVYNGRAWISMVSVHLKKMRPALGKFVSAGLAYHHIAYRLLVNCPVKTPVGLEWQRGIYFLNSFTDSWMFETVGNLMSEYSFQLARIKEIDDANGLLLTCKSRDKRHLIYAECDYSVGPKVSVSSNQSVEAIHNLIGPLTQAFSVRGKRVTRLPLCGSNGLLSPSPATSLKPPVLTTSNSKWLFGCDR